MPPKGPRGRGQKCVVARPIRVSNSHIKFGWISSNGLKRRNRDDWTDGGDCNIPIAFFFFFEKSVGTTMQYFFHFKHFTSRVTHNEIACSFFFHLRLKYTVDSK